MAALSGGVVCLFSDDPFSAFLTSEPSRREVYTVKPGFHIKLSACRPLNSRLVKLSFCDPHPAAPNQEYPVLTTVGEEGKNNLSAVWGGGGRDRVNVNLRARTGTETTEENHFGLSCFMAEY